jgi:hypothetical protein
MDCLRRNRNTAYGRRFGFSDMHTPGAYRDRLPLTAYDDLAPWIERIAQGETDILFAGRAVAFERTGGSTGGSRLIPYSNESLLDFRTAALPWLAEVIDTYGLGRGSAYWAISPAMRPYQETPGGVPIGLSDAAYLGREAIPAFLSTLAVPEWVGTIMDPRDWQLVTLYCLILREDIELISVWSPTYLLSLLAGLEERADEMASILRTGTEVAGHRLAADQAALVRLEVYLASAPSGTEQLWPGLKLVSCWADASSKPFYDALRQRIPHAPFQPKGLLSTEGAITAPDREGRPVLTANSGFYEFLDDRGKGLFAHELREKKQYEVVLTTSGGLYRYRTGDRIICQGWTGGWPILAFIGRCGVVSDLVGEKLNDAFIARCLEGIPGFRMLVPSIKGVPNYVLLLDARADLPTEPVIRSVEAALAKNPQYAYARRTGQLGGLELRHLADPAERFIRYKLEHGADLGNIKLPSLCPDSLLLSSMEDSP